MTELPKVVIYVQGGCVTGCASNNPLLQVCVVDRDSLEEEEDPDQAEKEALKGYENCVNDVY